MKTVRLTNKTLVSELLPSLIEKFKPDLVNSSVEKKAKLYVRHEEGRNLKHCKYFVTLSRILKASCVIKVPI